MTESWSAPSPASRLSGAQWRELRQWMLDHDPDAQQILAWTDKGRGMPASADHLAREIIWVILCAGRSAQAARTLERRVLAAIEAGGSAYEAFRYKAKANAIDRAWRERHQDYDQLLRLDGAPAEEFLAWCKSIPFIGDDTQFQLSKSLGRDYPKPDIWMCRVAGIPDKPRRAVHLRFEACMALCQHLAAETGDSVAAIDSLLWLACNKGVVNVGPDAGTVAVTLRLQGRSIYTAGESVPPASL